MKILVYIDDRPTSQHTPELAAQWIEHLPAQVTLVTAGGSETTRAAALRLAKAGHPPIASKLSDEPPVEVLCSVCESEDYDLVIVAPAGRSWLEHVIHGSRIGHMVHRLDTSVLVARQVPPAIRKILVGVGTARHTLLVVKTAVHVARAFQAQLGLVHVVSQMPLMFTGLEHMRLELEAFLKSELPGTDVLRKAREIAATAGLASTLHLREGLVRDELVREANAGGYDLLVIGAHPDQGWMSLWLDDITDHVVRDSSISTLVVRGEPRWVA